MTFDDLFNHYIPDGFFIQAAVKRAIIFAPYADLLWLETKTPDLAEARWFARKIRAKYPGK
jgi:isocitrate lyase